MTEYYNIVIAGIAVCLVSLSGLFSLYIKESLLKKVLSIWIAGAAGVMLSSSFIHLIPESIEHLSSLDESLSYVLIGIFVFFMIEKTVRIISNYSTHAGNTLKPIIHVNLVGDAVHNFIDGIIIAGSFLHSTEVGWITTIAVVVHEIPQEIGDTGVLIYGGLKPKKAIKYNFFCSLTVLIGILLTILMQKIFENFLNFLLPIAAGGFIYLAVAIMIPELQSERSFKKSMAQILSLFFGLVISALLNFTSHSH